MVAGLALAAIMMSLTLYIRQRTHLRVCEKNTTIQAYSTAKMTMAHMHFVIWMVLIILLLPLGGLAILSATVNDLSFYWHNALLVTVLFIGDFALYVITKWCTTFFVEKAYNMNSVTAKTFINNMQRRFLLIVIFFSPLCFYLIFIANEIPNYWWLWMWLFEDYNCGGGVYNPIFEFGFYISVWRI